ncbi:NAD-dependent epimerase [Segetibacter aerophilus]|uniref:NAD-dependent epimerase n=1 Tax=Segetibacter aerophilus TaxID=670293 RepID=A0A512BI55_9BACT|nr:NAD-dependent epimerase [Segetibacter aerophilus]GEO11631.1 NAD-dependent epimerase [Segetibacter aerophilus]
MKILVTGAAGFIGFHLALRLSSRGDTVVGVDSINDYYDIQLKYDRLAELGFEKNSITANKLIQSSTIPTCSFIQIKLEDKVSLDKLFEQEKFDIVVNLAAQAGVRYSLTNAQAYIDSNIIGFTNILELSRFHKIKHLVYGSSSSVYGLNESIPFSTAHNVDHPISLYAASKKSNELMAHVYSHLFNVPTTGLRFFTVYGPWGRPDMAYYIFTKSILEGTPIKVFNNGNMARDFTYVDDIVEGVIRVIDNPPEGNVDWSGKTPEPSNSKAPYQIYNIGKNEPVKLLDFITAIEEELGIEAKKEFHPLQPGDVTMTFADVSDLVGKLGYKPKTAVKEGIKKFVTWYKDYYKA